MRVAIVSGHTLSGPAEGTVAIKSEALEAREITKQLIDMCKSDKDITIIDCTVDKADDDASYIVEVSNKVNSAEADICILVEFGHSDYHTLSGSFVYTKDGVRYDETSIIANYLERFGYTVSFDASQSVFIDKINTPKLIELKLCCIDSGKDMEKYSSGKMVNALYTTLTKKDILNFWRCEPDGSILYCNDNGEYCTGVTEIDGEHYYFNEDGCMQFGFIELSYMKWMYADPKTGRLFHGEWLANMMQIYWADDDFMLALPNPENPDELATRLIDGITYTFDKNGCIENEKYRINGSSTISFYIADNGKVYPYIWGLDTVKSVYTPREK